MNKKDKIKLDALSNIDDEIIDKASEIRCSWLQNIGKKVKKSRIWLRVVAAAACICLIFGGGFFGILHFLGKQDPIHTNETKQTPIYTGMSVHNQAPSVSELVQDDEGLQIKLLSATEYEVETRSEIDQKDPYNKGEDGKNLNDSLEERFKNSIESAKGEYFAKKNEDVYFVIHIENPDNFVILSFTLNGTVYSSYMFEEGSDMENLILKYNVGNVEGEQSYTIDAIKYVDGEVIKDVIMEGERTVNVKIYPEEQPTVTVTKETVNFLGVSFVASVDDPKELISASDGKLYAMLYDGESLIQEKEISAGDTVTFEGLTPNTLYQYALVAFYDAIDGEGKKAHVLYEKAFYTESIIMIQPSELSGVDVDFSVNWSEDYTGTKQFDSLALYEGDTKLQDLDINSTKVSNLPFDKKLSLVATYTSNGQKFTVRCDIESPQSSQGLAMTGGVVTGIGSCQDTTIYINAPIGEKAFYQNAYLKEIYLGEGVTSIGASAFQKTKIKTITIPKYVESIGNYAFSDCSDFTSVYITDIAKWCEIDFDSYHANPLYYTKNLYLNGTLVRELVIPNSVTIIGSYAFYNCTGLTSITIPSNVTSIGDYAFEYCTGLETVNLGNGVETIGDSAFCACSRLTSITIPDSVNTIGNYAFHRCTELVNVTLGSGVETIRHYAFNGTKITSITIPDSVKTIGNYAFAECTDLATVTLGNGVETIGNYAFAGKPTFGLSYISNKITTITIPDSVKTIGRYAFAFSDIATITFGRGLETIDIGAFSRTKITSITIPDSVKMIAFGGDNCIVSFENTSGWYYTNDRDATSGTSIDVTSDMLKEVINNASLTGEILYLKRA